MDAAAKLGLLPWARLTGMQGKWAQQPLRRPAGGTDTHHSSRSVAAATMVRRAACGIEGEAAG